MKLSVFLLFLTAIAGCENNPTGSPGQTPPTDARGVYILHEGNFGDPAGARLALYDIEHDSVYFDLFEGANQGAHLGSLGDDISVVGDRVYLLMSGSENLKVISAEDQTLLQTANFPGSTPHDLLVDPISNRAYITQLFSSSVLVVDLGTLTAIDTVAVGANPQGMALAGNRLFVCNSGYGWDNTVTVIDPVSGIVETTVSLSDGPTTALVGPDGRVWIACTGNAFANPPTWGSLFAINPLTLIVEQSVTFSENLLGPMAVTADGTLFVLGVTGGNMLGGPVHRVSTAGAVFSNYISGSYYALAVDQASGLIYLADAMNFVSDGEVSIIDQGGVLTKRFTVQRGPGAFAFKR